jgi:hypothetical protein
MTVKLAVWAMIVSSTLALIAGGFFVFAHLQFVVGWMNLPKESVQEIQEGARNLMGKAFPPGNLDAWLGSINTAFQAMNAVVTFICSKFVNRNLPAVAEANGQWHWVSFVTALGDEARILRVKIGDMTVTNVHKQKERESSPGTVITGHDFEMDGRHLNPPVGFNATDVIVGTLGTERIIFTYQYAGGIDNDSGMSHLSLMRHAGAKGWFGKRGKVDLTLNDRFLVDGFVGRGEAIYFRQKTAAQNLYKQKLSEMQQWKPKAP